MKYTESYTELKSRHQREFGQFPIAFAFNQSQFADGLERLGINAEDAVRVPGGGFIRKSDKSTFLAMFKRHCEEDEEALRDDDFLLSALEYELGNHEYCITHDPEPALDAVGVSLDDERVARLYPIAKKRYLEVYYAWCDEQEKQA